MNVIDIIFWVSILLLGYTHIGYPMLLWALAKRCKRENVLSRYEPLVSVLVVVYNEADRIQKRLDNLLALDYPQHRLEIILACDGCDDKTTLLALKYQRAGIVVVTFNRRRGKSAVLNDLIPRASGDIVVFADARQRFNKNALLALTAHFANPKVGAVSGELILTNDDLDGSSVGEGVGFYWKYEKFIRRAESRVDSTVGVTGAIYALRRELFKTIPPDTILDDVLIPMQIVRRGYRVVFEPGARAFDYAAATAKEEFTRKVRTLAGNFQLFFRERWLLNPLANRLWLQTLSHKVFRLLSPLALAVSFIGNLFLLDQPFYYFTIAAQLIFYVAALGGYFIRDSHKKNRLLNIAYAFCLLNWAVVVGFVRYINGHQKVTWEGAITIGRPATGTGRLS